ncbi:MAG: hypothetical protein Ct9H300mP7_0980 [Verrucomicrobiota bacterium]|nr:MAG: hypothetical protein Ct9H300mP7_0980 [Verrucomicrobiota bacterium]
MAAQVAVGEDPGPNLPDLFTTLTLPDLALPMRSSASRTIDVCGAMDCERHCA